MRRKEIHKRHERRGPIQLLHDTSVENIFGI